MNDAVNGEGRGWWQQYQARLKQDTDIFYTPLHSNPVPLFLSFRKQKTELPRKLLNGGRFFSVFFRVCLFLRNIIKW